MHRSSTLFLSLLIGATDLFATRYHVNAAASGTGTGLSWANAYTDLQAALSVVVAGDEVWVATGQYKPTTGTDRTIAFVLRNGVDLYGGFAGNETSLGQRDIANNPTLLNGDIGQPGDPADNSHNVLRADNLTTATVLDGFTVLNGRSGSGYNGGGLKVTNALNGGLQVRNCTFANNYASVYGGGIYLAAADLLVADCVFNGNTTGNSGDGGAIFNGNNNGGSSVLTIERCRFVNNVARRGACLFNSVDYQSLVVDRCIFTNNVSPFSIVSVEYFAQARIVNSYLIGNTVSEPSGNVLFANSISATEDLVVANTTIAHNFNLYPGAVSSEMVKLTESYHRMHNCIIHGNTPYAGRQVNPTPAIASSIVEGGHANGTGIIDLDPEFTAPFTGVPAAFDATQHDYHPLFSSPAVNAGDNGLVQAGWPLDLDGGARVQGGIVDMGCYESPLGVGVAYPLQAGLGWSYDALNGLIVLAGPAPSGEPIDVFDAAGRRIMRVRTQGAIAPVHLGPGAYIAVSPLRRPLRFVVAGW